MTTQLLAHKNLLITGVVDAWLRNSAHRRDWTARTLRSAAEMRGLELKDAVVAVWGLAYKENTHSVKNSPSLHFIAAGGIGDGRGARRRATAHARRVQHLARQWRISIRARSEGLRGLRARVGPAHRRVSL